MTPPAAGDPGWETRVRGADVPIELFDAELDDHGFAFLERSIMRALRDQTLSDEDLYPLLVRIWTGCVATFDWPRQASHVARRCATTLAAERACELGAFSAPTDRAVQMACDAVVTELGLTSRDLLAVLADNWQELSDHEMPDQRECTLLAFAQHVLLEPVTAACVLTWSVLNSVTEVPDTRQPIACDGWSPAAGDDWRDVVRAELSVLGQPDQQVPDDGDEAGLVLSYARAHVLRTTEEHGRIADSIVRTSGWPGATDLIDPLAHEAVQLALGHRADIDVESDNDDVIDTVQRRLMPGDDTLVAWIRDPAFATVIDPIGSARNGAEMLSQAADWLTWSVSRDAVEAVRATLMPPQAATGQKPAAP